MVGDLGAECDFYRGKGPALPWLGGVADYNLNCLFKLSSPFILLAPVAPTHPSPLLGADSR